MPEWGIRVFNRNAPLQGWQKFVLRPGLKFLGRSALSPLGTWLAVVNLCDGVDWYHVGQRRFESTSMYTMKEKFMVCISFTGHHTAVVGHTGGGVVMVDNSTRATPRRHKIWGNSRSNVLAVGRNGEDVLVAMASFSRRSPDPKAETTASASFGSDADMYRNLCIHRQRRRRSVQYFEEVSARASAEEPENLPKVDSAVEGDWIIGVAEDIDLRLHRMSRQKMLWIAVVVVIAACLAIFTGEKSIPTYLPVRTMTVTHTTTATRTMTSTQTITSLPTKMLDKEKTDANTAWLIVLGVAISMVWVLFFCIMAVRLGATFPHIRHLGVE